MKFSVAFGWALTAIVLAVLGFSSCGGDTSLDSAGIQPEAIAGLLPALPTGAIRDANAVTSDTLLGSAAIDQSVSGTSIIGDDFRKGQPAHASLAWPHTAAGLRFELIRAKRSQFKRLPYLPGGDLLASADNG